MGRLGLTESRITWGLPLGIVLTALIEAGRLNTYCGWPHWFPSWDPGVCGREGPKVACIHGPLPSDGDAM